MDYISSPPRSSGVARGWVVKKYTEFIRMIVSKMFWKDALGETNIKDRNCSTWIRPGPSLF